MGAIAVGRYGDLVAVTGDPDANVRLLEKPDAVVKGAVRWFLDHADRGFLG